MNYKFLLVWIGLETFLVYVYVFLKTKYKV